MPYDPLDAIFEDEDKLQRLRALAAGAFSKIDQGLGTEFKSREEFENLMDAIQVKANQRPKTES